jgi:hypothetical protein
MYLFKIIIPSLGQKPVCKITRRQSPKESTNIRLARSAAEARTVNKRWDTGERKLKENKNSREKKEICHFPQGSDWPR